MKNNIILTEEEKKYLRLFFSKNYNFIINNDLSIYDNIKILCNAYEKFIDENSLRENNVMISFLLELKNYELTILKINNKSKNKIHVKVLNVEDSNIKDRINEWYNSCYDIEQKDNHILTAQYVKELNKGISYRILQRKLDSYLK